MRTDTVTEKKHFYGSASFVHLYIRQEYVARVRKFAACEQVDFPSVQAFRVPFGHLRLRGNLLPFGAVFGADVTKKST